MFVFPHAAQPSNRQRHDKTRRLLTFCLPVCGLEVYVSIIKGQELINGLRLMPCAANTMPTPTVEHDGSDLGKETARQLSLWLQQPDFVFSLPFHAQGSDFQRRVWRAIADIPCGETRTYGALAQTLTSAARAVGQACKSNPLPIFLPCHRVVSAHGLGGFNGSQENHAVIKRWLLRRESEWLANHNGKRPASPPD